jgi:hypothetical protein
MSKQACEQIPKINERHQQDLNLRGRNHKISDAECIQVLPINHSGIVTFFWLITNCGLFCNIKILIKMPQISRNGSILEPHFNVQ